MLHLYSTDPSKTVKKEGKKAKTTKKKTTPAKVVQVQQGKLTEKDLHLEYPQVICWQRGKHRDEMLIAEFEWVETNVH